MFGYTFTDRFIAVAYNNRGLAWSSKREYDNAIGDDSEAIRPNLKGADASNARAWLWAGCPDARFRDGKREVEIVTRACELSNWKDPRSLDMLAAACAEAGDFEQAVERQSQAIGLLTDAKEKEDYATRLKRYREQTPYREISP